MKKIIMILIICILPCVAHSANMCVKDDAYVIVFDPLVGGTANGNNASTKTWSTKFPYGIISGIGGCYNNVGATQGAPASDQVNISVSSTGGYCYCKMLRPFESPWVYSGYYYNNLKYCAPNCASSCSSNAASAVALRRGLFADHGI